MYGNSQIKGEKKATTYWYTMKFKASMGFLKLRSLKPLYINICTQNQLKT